MQIEGWKVIEDIDGAYVFPITREQTPDDWIFSRVRPVAKINEHAPAEIVSQFCRFINKTDKITERKHISRAIRLQRQHEAQSNAAAVKDGSVIKSHKTWIRNTICESTAMEPRNVRSGYLGWNL